MASKSTEKGNLMTNEMQCAVHTCEIHTSEVMDMYCSTCKQPHCLLCIKEKHISHDWDRLSKIAKTLRDEIPSKCQTVRETTVVRIQDYLDEIRDKRLSLSNLKEETISQINRQKENILFLVDSRIMEMISDLKDSAEVIENKLDSMESHLRSDLTDVRQCADTLEQNRLAGSDNVIVKFARKLDVKIKGIQNPDIGNLPRCPDFIVGKVKTREIEYMIGSLKIENQTKSDVKRNERPFVKVHDKTTDFKHGEKEIIAIGQADDKCVWVLNHNASKIEMLTLDGIKRNIQKDLKTLVTDFVISQNGDFIFTAYNTCSINKLSSDGKIIKIHDTTPLHPEAIGICANGEFLTALIDKYDYSTDSKSSRLVRRITMSGDVKTTYQYEKKNKTNLFTAPVSVCENKNSNICVVDRTTSRSGRLCVLLTDGGVKFTYSGQKLKKSFCPLYVICDPKCNIIVTDWENSSIYLLGPDGQFLKFLATAENGLKFPRSLCLYKTNLWIGCLYGNIKLVEHKS